MSLPEKEMLNRVDLNSRRNDINDGMVLTDDGRVFQARVAAAGKARSTSVDRRVGEQQVWAQHQIGGIVVRQHQWSAGLYRRGTAAQYRLGNNTTEHINKTGFVTKAPGRAVATGREVRESGRE